MTNSTTSPPARIDSLTWLRGVAAFVVVLYHVKRTVNVSYFGDDAAAEYGLMELLDLGIFGVLMFFVISGCTLYLNHPRLDGAAAIGRFALQRIFRIWPAFFVSMLVFMALVPVFQAFYLDPLPGHWIEVHAREFGLSEVLLYLGLIFNLTGPPQYFNIVYWSLPIEFQYYLLFPLLLLSLHRLSLFGPVLTGGLLYLAYSLDIGRFIDNEWTLLFAYTFCGGVLLGHLYSRFGSRLRLPPLAALSILTPLMVLLSLLEANIIGLPELARRIPIINEALNWQGFSAILVVAVVLFTRAPHGFRGGRVYGWFMHYGEVSYSVYLYHMLFAAISVLIFVNAGITAAWAKLALTLVLMLAGSFWLADLSYRHVERRGIRFGRALLDGRLRKPLETGAR